MTDYDVFPLYRVITMQDIGENITTSLYNNIRCTCVYLPPSNSIANKLCEQTSSFGSRNMVYASHSVGFIFPT